MNSSTHRLRQARFQQERLPARNERARGHVMRGWGGWLSVILLTAGCGGRSAHTSVDPGDERSGSNDGGTPGSDSGAGGAGAASDAGAPDMAYQSLIRSGTRRCENEDYCFGLSCYAPPGFAPTVCLASCQKRRELRAVRGLLERSSARADLLCALQVARRLLLRFRLFRFLGRRRAGLLSCALDRKSRFTRLLSDRRLLAPRTPSVAQCGFEVSSEACSVHRD